MMQTIEEVLLFDLVDAFRIYKGNFYIPCTILYIVDVNLFMSMCQLCYWVELNTLPVHYIFGLIFDVEKV
jgi:hypothetical protein